MNYREAIKYLVALLGGDNLLRQYGGFINILSQVYPSNTLALFMTIKTFHGIPNSSQGAVIGERVNGVCT